MRRRRIIGATAGLVFALVGMAPAGAVQRPRSLYRLGNEQTQLWENSYGIDVPLSAPSCVRSRVDDDVLILPVLEPAGMNASQSTTCRMRRGEAVLVDGFGSVDTEDNHKCATEPAVCYPVLDPVTNKKVLQPFTPATLDAIATQLLADLGAPGTATLDGKPLRLPLVITPVFEAHVPKTAPNYADSVALDHPGRLAADFAGSKVLIEGLSRGKHTIVLTSNWFTGTTITHTIYVS